MNSIVIGADHDCCHCEVHSPLFCLLTPEEMKLLKKNKTTVSFRAGETIRKQGVQLTHVISLNSGMAKVYLEGINNQNAIIRIVKPTNFIGGPGLYYDQLHHYSVTALTDSTVCFIDATIFKDLIEKNHEFAKKFLEDFSKNVLSVYNRLVYLTQKHMHGRMADTLLYLIHEIYLSHKFTLYLSKQDLAELSGLSKDSAIKILREFQKDGIINYSDKELEILNEDSLQRISRTG
jgi:CRP/FNR family transcriptional regulator